MPPIETDGLIHKAVLWKFKRRDGYGEPVVHPPVEIDARWRWARTQSVGPDGQTIALDASIIVAEEVDLDGVIWQGTLKQWNALPADAADRKLMQVKTSSTVEDIKGVEQKRRVGAARFKNTLPTVEA